MFYYKSYQKMRDQDPLQLEKEMQNDFIEALDCEEKVKVILKELR